MKIALAVLIPIIAPLAKDSGLVVVDGKLRDGATVRCEFHLEAGGEHVELPRPVTGRCELRDDPYGEGKAAWATAGETWTPPRGMVEAFWQPSSAVMDRGEWCAQGGCAPWCATGGWMLIDTCGLAGGTQKSNPSHGGVTPHPTPAPPPLPPEPIPAVPLPAPVLLLVMALGSLYFAAGTTLAKIYAGAAAAMVLAPSASRASKRK